MSRKALARTTKMAKLIAVTRVVIIRVKYGNANVAISYTYYNYLSNESVILKPYLQKYLYFFKQSGNEIKRNKNAQARDKHLDQSLEYISLVEFC